MKSLRKLFGKLGPGFITGASDDDPSGIGTYSNTGAAFGYSQLWTALFTFPLTTVVQEMCGRIGLVTGKGLAGVIRTHYSKKLLYFAVTLLLIANTMNIGADLGAMASAAQLLIPLPFTTLLILMTAVTLVLEIFVSYEVYARYLKYLALSLLVYVLTLFVVKQDWHAILLATVVPTIVFSRDYLINIVAILGTTLSPYLFFWQTSQETEERRSRRALSRFQPVQKRDITAMRKDTMWGMFFSNLIMFFIIASTASTLFPAGIHRIETATDAALALRPVAGDLSFVLFAIGIIGTGLLAVPILAGSASYALSEAFGWKTGLYQKLRHARGFYGIITISTILGLMINFSSVKPFTLLYYTAILNGICAPPLIFIILKIANNRKILGKHTNSLGINIVGYGVGIIMSVCAVALLVMLV